MNSKKDIGNLCRIKVNKMLSSLNSNKNIFIPKYTISCRDEEKYLYLNKAKGNPKKQNHNYFKKNKLNKSNIITTEENYDKQPIDFIINHGVLVYQRNFRGEEVVNMGINNEYLRKNNFNMVKNDNTIYQTDSNFRKIKVQNNGSQKSNSIQKKLKLNNSKRTLASFSDIPASKNSKNKNSSSRQKKILSTNLNTTQNSISSVNSISVKNFMICPKTKVVNENENNKNSKNVKKVINYVRKKKNSINNNNKILFKKKKNNSTSFGNNENIMINNKSDIKSIKNNYMISNISDNRYKTNYISKNNTKKREEVRKINNKTLKNEFLIYKNNIIKEKLFKLISNIKVLAHYYLKIYFDLFKVNLSKTMKNIYEKNLTINTNIQDDKIDKIDINKIILEKCRQNKNFQYQNSFYNPTHKKSNSIIVNKKMSSNTASLKELSKNNSNKNLSFLISKNLRFFSREKDINYKNGTYKPELFRDSESLKKKYEQICRRKKRHLTMTYTSKFKANVSSSEGNLFSDVNKTNSFSAMNDNNSVNSLKLKNNQMKLLNYNENNFLTEKNKNLTDNKKNKNSYKIKLLKGYDKNKKIISYRIEKNSNKNDINNNIIKDKILTENNYEVKNIS